MIRVVRVDPPRDPLPGDRVSVADLDVDDRVIWTTSSNRRGSPVPVIDVEEVRDDVGAIFVVRRVYCCGPQGADIRIESTGTGRIRVAESRYAPPANVHELRRVVTADA